MFVYYMRFVYIYGTYLYDHRRVSTSPMYRFNFLPRPKLSVILGVICAAFARPAPAPRIVVVVCLLRESIVFVQGSQSVVNVGW